MSTDIKKVIVIGCGSRGMGYSARMKRSGKFEVVAVADPIPERRSYTADLYDVPESMRFESWEPLIALGRIADVAIVSTMDRDHFAPAVAAINAGYNLLLEKPVSPVPEECREIERLAKKKGVFVLVCHVLRYTDFYRALKRVIKQGMLGRIMSIEAAENVGVRHMSHSFVRGNWGNSERSSFMLLQKCCHDMDILQWLIDKKCLRVQSFGSLKYFKAENAPEGAPERCHEGCPAGNSCIYNAMKLYYEAKNNAWFRGAATRLPNPTDADVMRALENTNYGRCVFKCDNDVVDHQTVNMEFEDGITCSFSMCAFSGGGRTIHIMGTKGELFAGASDTELKLRMFNTGETIIVPVADDTADQSIVSGHGGGDDGIVLALYDLLSGRDNGSVSTITESVDNHMIAFAAEKSRLEGRVVEISELG